MAPDNEDSEQTEESVYGGGRAELMEADEISGAEEGFMAGYDTSEREEEDSASDVYEQAFAGRAKPKKRATRKEDDDEEDPEDE